MEEMRWQVGELARATGLTVRTLHHWDALGLLTPSERTGAGYRLYDERDVRRLYQIVALRSLGLSLEQVKDALDAGVELSLLVRRQLDAVDSEIELQQKLRERLTGVLEAPTTLALIETIEVMTMIEKHYTAEQLETLAKRGTALGRAGLEQAQAAWVKVSEGLERERAAGTDPADPSVQELVDRADALIEAFTGGDPEVRASLERLYREEGPERASRGLITPESFEYMARARAARR